MIHYLMYIDTHGDISQIRIAKGVNPTDRAMDPEVGQYCVHYMEALSDIGGFHASKVWNYTTEQWDTRALRPNYHAVGMCTRSYKTLGWKEITVLLSVTGL